MTSISITSSGRARPLTCTSVLAGVVAPKYRSADFPKDRHLRHVGHVRIHLHDIRERRAGRLQGRLEILEHLLGLRFHVTCADDLPARIERHLSGDVDQSSPGQ